MLFEAYAPNPDHFHGAMFMLGAAVGDYLRAPYARLQHRRARAADWCGDHGRDRKKIPGGEV